MARARTHTHTHTHTHSRLRTVVALEGVQLPLEGPVVLQRGAALQLQLQGSHLVLQVSHPTLRLLCW